MKSHAVQREKQKERLSLDEGDRFFGDLDTCNNGHVPRRSSRKPRNIGLSTNDIYSQRNISSSSSIFEIDQQEEEEVSLCLMLLSRDLDTAKTMGGNGLNLLKRGGKSDSEENVKSEDLVMDCAKDIFVVDVLESDKRSKFECNTCKKIFHSHQAHGGHRASHKKTKGCNERSETPTFHHYSQAKEINSRMVVQKNECPICFRVFPSGQALGGHKRSHFLTILPSKSKVVTNKKSVTSHGVGDFLDLNQPTLVEEKVVGFKPWWVDNTRKHEDIVGMI